MCPLFLGAGFFQGAFRLVDRVVDFVIPEAKPADAPGGESGHGGRDCFESKQIGFVA